MVHIALQTQKGGAINPSPFVEGDEIHQKIHDMLEASESIKPGSGSAKGIATTKKIFRGKKRSLRSRVAKVFGRVVGKRAVSSQSSFKRESKKGAFGESDELPVTRPVISWPLELQSPTNVAIRVNESLSLCKGKMQRTLGGSVGRKPVPIAQQHTEPRVSSEYDADSSDQDNHSVGSLDTLDEVDAESAASGEQEHELAENPFEIESGFDSYLDDGVLSSLPTGASTPGIHLAMSSGDEALIAAESPAIGEVGGSELEVPNLSPEAAYRLDFEDGWSLQEEQHLQMEHIRQRVLREGESVKKHPSPSKFALEVLSKALAFSERHGGLLDREQNELAESYAASQRFLAPQDDGARSTPILPRDAEMEGPLS